MDLSYRFRPETNQVSYREAADPSVVSFKDKYYLFASKSGGYWSSDDLTNWNFIKSKGLPTEDYAPGVIAIGDTLFFAASAGSPRPIYKTAHPETGTWEIANPKFPFKIWDPAFLLDNDGRLYLYWGCSPKDPLYGIELDPKTMNPIGKRKELLASNIAEHGWECQGDNNELTSSPWLEGAWVDKHDGKYYLQYAVPGTEMRTYADGYYVSDNPLGPYNYSPHSPFSRRPKGYATGTGHSCTFRDKEGNDWHLTTMIIGVKHMFERRLCLLPADIDKDDVLFTRTAYADYPHYIPTQERDLKDKSDFTGWMLLSYNKPVTASSELEQYKLTNSVDENVKTYWAAQTGANEWLQIDLQKVSKINALQINFAEHETSIYDRNPEIYYQYKTEYSLDGKDWKLLIDKSQSKEDRPHAYYPLKKEIDARYLKLSIQKVPGGKVAVSGFRIFGQAPGKIPEEVQGLTIKRNKDDDREVKVSWQPQVSAQGYVLRYGIDPDKLYQSVMVYDQNEIVQKSLNAGEDYYFTVEAFNESGIGARSRTIPGASNQTK